MQWMNMLKVENCTYALVSQPLICCLTPVTFGEFMSLVEHGW